MNTDEEAAGLRIRAQAGIGIPHGDNELTRALLAVLDERDTQAARIVQLEKKMASDHAQYLDFVSSSAAEIGRLEKQIVYLRGRVSTLEAEQQDATNQAARIRELEEALRFYADPENWDDKSFPDDGDYIESCEAWWKDCGKRARQALGQKEEAGSDG